MQEHNSYYVKELFHNNLSFISLLDYSVQEKKKIISFGLLYVLHVDIWLAHGLSDLIKLGSWNCEALLVQGVDDVLGVFVGVLEELVEGALGHKVQFPCLQKQLRGGGNFHIHIIFWEFNFLTELYKFSCKMQTTQISPATPFEATFMIDIVMTTAPFTRGFQLASGCILFDPDSNPPLEVG